MNGEYAARGRAQASGPAHKASRGTVSSDQLSGNGTLSLIRRLFADQVKIPVVVFEVEHLPVG